MKEPTLVINHSAAPIVTIHAQHQENRRLMKEFTLVKNHLTVPSVTTNAIGQTL